MTFLVIVHIFICFFLIAVILVQPGKSDGGLSFGSSSQSIFGSKGAGNFLTRTTSVCALVFLLTSFILTRSRIKEFKDSVVPLTTESSAPTVPATPPAAQDPGKKK